MGNATGITGLILAGGKSTRMGGRDKAALRLNGRPMIEWVIDRLRPQVDTLLINSNSLAQSDFSYPIIADSITGHRGPLAGLHAAMACAKTPLLACVPCDAPLLPFDLVERLRMALADADIAVAKTPSSLQPAFLLCRATLRPSIEAYLAEGKYALRHWMVRHHCVEVEFSDEAAFSNINTPEEVLSVMPKLML